MTRTSVEVWGIPTCGSTRKALKLLESLGIPYLFRNYREVRPTRSLLKEAMASVSGPKKLFNTSGASYREGGFKGVADTMSEGEILDSLLADPMLIKRPIVRSGKGIVVGYDLERIRAVL